MAKPELIQSVTTLSGKVDSLLEQVKSLNDKVISLQKENSELRRRHLDDINELELAKRDIEFLSLSHRLAGSPEALVKARAKITKILDTIDSCIQIINTD